MTEYSRDELREFHAERFVEHPGTEKVFSECDYILKTAGLKSRPDNLIILAESGYGKSALLREVFKGASHHTYIGKNLLNRECLLIEMSSMPSSRQLLLDIVRALGGVEHTKISLEYCEQMIVEKGLKLLIIDEFNNLFETTKPELRKSLNILKTLGNKYNVSIILAGTGLIDKILDYDRQFDRRYRKIRMKNWKLDDYFRNFVMNYMALLPVEFPKKISSAIFSELLEGTSGSTKEVIRVLCQASLEAHIAGEEDKLANYIGRVAKRTGNVSD